MRYNIALTGLAVLALGLACNKEGSSSNPEAGNNLLGPSAGPGGASGLGGDADDDDPWADEGSGLEDDGEAVAVAALPDLPKRSDPVEKCTGKGAKRECKLVDPKPKVSAAYGVRTLMGDYRWGMSAMDVFKLMSADIETEYKERQKAAKDAIAQDNNRKWRQEQLQRIKANHVKFTANSNHRWGVSLIQYEYEDDANEEMLWIKTTTGLRKFYFFKNGDLWKIYYAYSTDTWPGKAYEEVVDEKFRKWFGASPVAKVQQDPETAEPILRYYEWTALDGEKIRSFDMTQIHGVIALAVIDGKAEKSLGERLPNTKRKERVNDVVEGVLGGSDVCYDKGGEIVHCEGGGVR
jgi:hypothetical protein